MGHDLAQVDTAPQKKSRLTSYIIGSMLLGIFVGYLVNTNAIGSFTPEDFAHYISLLTTIFLKMIKMIIAPLVFSTLVVGIAKMGDSSTVGRIGAKTFGWFILMSFCSLLIGLVMVNLLQPGVGVNLPIPAANASAGVSASSMNLVDFVSHVFPTSIIDAMAKNEILQIVVFSLFFGVSCAALGKKAEPFIEVVDMLSHVMLKFTSIIMKFAPFAVFAAVSSVIAKEGLEVVGTYAKFMISFYLAIGALWLFIIAAGFIFIGKSVFKLVYMLKEPILLAFSTASSEAAYPKTLEQLERFGCKNKIASFVLPIGYSFNLDGSMMYSTFAVMFIAQVYGIELSIQHQLTMLLILMVTSKGMAGIPRASIVVIAATLAHFNIPEAGILLILGVDHFLDMARSATNVVGNAVATAVVSKWEGELTRKDV